MSYKIEKTKTQKEIIDFKAEYLQDCNQQGYNLTLAEDENYIYALEAWETLANGVVSGSEDDATYQATITEAEEKAQALKTITKRQMLIWLYNNKSITETNITTAIEAITDEATQYLATVSYNGTNNFYYGDTYLQTIATALGLSTDELKTMFDEASIL